MNLYEYKSIEIHWKAFCVSGGNVKYFDSFRVKYFPKDEKKFLSNKSSKTNVYRIQANDSIFLDTFVLDLMTLCEKVQFC